MSACINASPPEKSSLSTVGRIFSNTSSITSGVGISISLRKSDFIFGDPT